MVCLDRRDVGFHRRSDHRRPVARNCRSLHQPGAERGWVIGNSDDPEDSEIGDLCEDIAVAGEVDGVRVAPYYSKLNNACILPTARSVRLFLTIKGIDGTNGNPIARFAGNVASPVPQDLSMATCGAYWIAPNLIST